MRPCAIGTPELSEQTHTWDLDVYFTIFESYGWPSAQWCEKNIKVH